MSGHLNGRLALRKETEVVLDVGGVGYRLQVNSATVAQLPEVGERLRLFTHLAVREDALTLYGFASDEERDLFEVLLTVTGVGPRVALGLVGALPPKTLIEAIATGDVARLSSAPGIGKRLAQRLVVELADKVGQRGWAVEAEGGGAPADVVEALTGLGFSMTEARRATRAALNKLGEGASTEELLRESLRLTGE
ncbi:MAG: Holliday junction branch migration protein RuvA [Armatimonadetes bacterium]|nr:Holliday junction branch migration protein RuvA [Armatimonadota bacterium]